MPPRHAPASRSATDADAGSFIVRYVAASRVQGNRHYISDVIMGAAIGVVAGRTVTLGKNGAAFEVSPSLSGAGVGVTIVRKRR